MGGLGGPLWTRHPAGFNVLPVSRSLRDSPRLAAVRVASAPRRAGVQSAPRLPTPVLSRQWIERVVGWLGKVFLQDGPARPASPEAGNTLRRWRCHVQRFFYRIYAGLRIEELFSIIRGRPPAR